MKNFLIGKAHSNKVIRSILPAILLTGPLWSLGAQGEENAVVPSLKLVLDGNSLRCNEGGDTLANSLGYQLNSPKLSFDSKYLFLNLKFKSVYLRCSATKSGSVAIRKQSPFSPFSYVMPDKGEVTVVGKTVEMIVTNSEDQLIRQSSVNSNSGAVVDFDFNLPLETFLDKEGYQSLISHKPAQFKIYLTSRMEQRVTVANTEIESNGLGAGGSYVLTGTLNLESETSVLSDIRLSIQQ
jgi:hypothetical protein